MYKRQDESTGKYGDCVVLDIGCLLNGYCSDMTRTVFLGKASDEARKIYEIVKEANRRGIEAVGPGARFSDVDKAARDYITEMGYGDAFTHRTGPVSYTHLLTNTIISMDTTLMWISLSMVRF